VHEPNAIEAVVGWLDAMRRGWGNRQTAELPAEQGALPPNLRAAAAGLGLTGLIEELVSPDDQERPTPRRSRTRFHPGCGRPCSPGPRSRSSFLSGHVVGPSLALGCV
jgi:hypothetical protein